MTVLLYCFIMIEKILDPYILSGAAGMLFSALIVYYLGQKRPYVKGYLILGYLSAIIGMFIGAHLLFFIVGLPDFISSYKDTVYSVQSFINAVLNASSGMVFYGGLLGAMLGVIIYCRVSHINGRTYMNIASCAFPMLHAFGRIGCALGGCCYGIEYHGLFAIQYTAAQIKPGISDHIADFPRFPVQPMEALIEFLICFIMIRIYLKYENRYSIAAIYLFTYGIVRFSDEFLRGDVIRGLWGPFSTSQWIALFCIIGTVIYFISKRLSLKKNVAEG